MVKCTFNCLSVFVGTYTRSCLSAGDFMCGSVSMSVCMSVWLCLCLCVVVYDCLYLLCVCRCVYESMSLYEIMSVC